MVWKIDPNELSQIVIYRSNSTHVYVNVIIYLTFIRFLEI